MTMKKKRLIFELVVGDWSDDGHGKTDKFLIYSNFSKEQILAAYKKGAMMLGVDVTRDVCHKYEDSYLENEQWKKFEAAGMTLHELFQDEEFETDIDSKFCIYTDSFVRLWLFTVKLGDPSFENEFVRFSDIHIGGYGLFEC